MSDTNLKTVKIGTADSQKLLPKKCLVVSVDTELIEKAKNNKAIFELKHPDEEIPIKVSSAVVMKMKKDKKEIVSYGTWLTLDKDNLLDKNTATAQVLKKYGASCLSEMIGKDVETETDTSGYLAIKAY